jgi:hypothetical protein
LLELFDGGFSCRSEIAVDNKPEIRSAAQRPLEPADGTTGCA